MTYLIKLGIRVAGASGCPNSLSPRERAAVFNGVLEACLTRDCELIAAQVRPYEVEVILDSVDPPDRIVRALRFHTRRRLLGTGAWPVRLTAPGKGITMLGGKQRRASALTAVLTGEPQAMYAGPAAG